MFTVTNYQKETYIFDHKSSTYEYCLEFVSQESHPVCFSHWFFCRSQSCSSGVTIMFFVKMLLRGLLTWPWACVSFRVGSFFFFLKCVLFPRYKLHVLASDGKWEDYTTVTVNVVNKNDESPVFTVNEYYGSVTEELDGSPVFVLQVLFCLIPAAWCKWTRPPFFFFSCFFKYYQ